LIWKLCKHVHQLQLKIRSFKLSYSFVKEVMNSWCIVRS
jgi:hypothetical protein